MESCGSFCISEKSKRKNALQFSGPRKAEMRGDQPGHGTGASLDREALSRYMFTYTARETAEAGLMFYRARYYSSGIARFISEDPASLTFDLYTYVDNSPSDSIDPYGLYRIVEHIKPIPHSTRQALDEACKPYLTAGECASIRGKLDWACHCEGNIWRLETTITLSGVIHYFDGQLPIRPPVDRMFGRGAPKQAASRHVESFHTGVALGSLLPQVVAAEMVPYFNPFTCNLAGLFLAERFSEFFDQEMLRTKNEEGRGRRPRVRTRNWFE